MYVQKQIGILKTTTYLFQMTTTTSHNDLQAPFYLGFINPLFGFGGNYVVFMWWGHKVLIMVVGLQFMFM